MLEGVLLETVKEIIDTGKEIKDPERRINLWVSLIIAGALSFVIIFLFRLSDSKQERTNSDLKEENTQLKIDNANLQHDKDSLMAAQYHYVLDELNNEKKVKEFVVSQDSLNTELRHIKQKLTSQ